MFSNRGEISEVKECRPNYEDMAARLKKRIEADKLCLEGMIAGLHSGSIDLDREQRVLYHAVIGALYINIPRAEAEYEAILKKLEEEK